MNPNVYQRLAQRTECDQVHSRQRITGGFRNVRLLQAALGLSSESGEFCDAVHRAMYYGQELDETNLKEELGNLLWFVAEACNALGIEMSDVMEANIAKLQSRFPKKFDAVRAEEENRDRQRDAQIVKGKKGDDGPDYYADGEGEDFYDIEETSEQEEYEDTLSKLESELDSIGEEIQDEPRDRQRSGPVKGMTKDLSGNRYMCEHCSTPISDEVVKRYNSRVGYTYSCPECQTLFGESLNDAEAI